MKIISKYKDYYDFLQGIYGVDDKLILDRTEYTTPSSEITSDYTPIDLYICGYLVQGMWMNGKVLYGNDLTPFEFKHKFIGRYFAPRNLLNSYPIDDPNAEMKIIRIRIPDQRYPIGRFKSPIKLKSGNPNDALQCPIIIKVSNDHKYRKFPILREYNFSSVMTPEQIWIMLTDWLSSKIDVPFVDSRTDAEKLESHGFDKRISFRKR